jgi:DNA-binding GntR family transcriptional regulator
MAAPDKLVIQIVERIEDKIALGEYRPGDRLRQEQLAEEFSISRTPVREALRLLEAKGVISQEHRHSAVIRAPSTREVRETYQVRAELEGLAAALAAQWITDKHVEGLRAIHARFVASVKDMTTPKNSAPKKRNLLKASNTWIETNDQFHRLIQQASNNLRLAQAINELYVGFIRNVMSSSARGMDSHRMQRNIHSHEEILTALERRDANAARKAMQDHIHESGHLVIAWLENQMVKPA